MMARMLMISDEVKDVLKKLVAKAAERPTTFEQLTEAAKTPNAANKENPDNNDLTVTIPRGYRVTYTEEYQRPDVRCRHMSVSLLDGKPGTGAAPEAVQEICLMLGYTRPIHECYVYLGTIKGGLVINVVEPMSGNMDDLRSKSDA
jgi:hypothetical protein